MALSAPNRKLMFGLLIPMVLGAVYLVIARMTLQFEETFLSFGADLPYLTRLILSYRYWLVCFSLIAAIHFFSYFFSDEMATEMDKKFIRILSIHIGFMGFVLVLVMIGMYMPI